MSFQQHYCYDDNASDIHIRVEAPNDLYPQVLAVVTAQLLDALMMEVSSQWLSLRLDNQGAALSMGHGTFIEAPHLLAIVEHIFGRQLPGPDGDDA